MKRIIVDYKKLTPQLLKLLTEKFPDGYNDKDIITFDAYPLFLAERSVATATTIALFVVSATVAAVETHFPFSVIIISAECSK